LRAVSCRRRRAVAIAPRHVAPAQAGPPQCGAIYLPRSAHQQRTLSVHGPTRPNSSAERWVPAWLMPFRCCRESEVVRAIVPIAWQTTGTTTPSQSAEVCVSVTSCRGSPSEILTWQWTGPMALGGGTDLCLAQPVPPTACALWEAGGYPRGVPSPRVFSYLLEFPGRHDLHRWMTVTPPGCEAEFHTGPTHCTRTCSLLAR